MRVQMEPSAVAWVNAKCGPDRETMEMIRHIHGDRFPCVHGVDYIGEDCPRCSAYLNSQFKAGNWDAVIPPDATSDIGRDELWATFPNGAA